MSERLEAIMVYQKMTQTKLAQKASITQAEVSRILYNVCKNPRIHIVNRIAKALGVPLDYLVNGKK